MAILYIMVSFLRELLVNDPQYNRIETSKPEYHLAYIKNMCTSEKL